MATHAGRLIQDQNLKVHFDGAPVGGKGNVSMAQKKGGGFGGRKALNDISNSGKPSALQASRKHNFMNVISIGEDLGGRKALSDLRNSGKPSAHQVAKKSQDKKLIAVAEEENFPRSVAEECFLHNHQKCIKAQRKAVDMDYFLKTVGLDDDISMQLASPRALPLSRNSKPESPLKHLKMEEISELMVEDRPPYSRKLELLPSEQNSPVCGSPNSPKPYMHWKDHNFHDFILMESP